MIDSPLHGNIDIHGFGKGDKDITPLNHGVIGHSLSRQLFKIRYKPPSETNKLQSNEVFDFSYKYFLGKMISIKIQIIIYQIKHIHCNRLLHLPVTYDHLKGAVTSPPINDNIDVSINICKTFEEKIYSLIRMRYHNMNITCDIQLSKDLLNDLKQKISHGGYECIRSAGSSGLTQINHNFLNFFKESNKNLPKAKCCVKVLRTRTKWICIYVSKKSCELNKTIAVWKYAQLQQGGSFKMSNDIIKISYN